MRRRHFVLCSCSAAVFPCATSAKSIRQKYCALDSSFSPGKINRFSSSGNRALDRALIAELKTMLRVFPVNPGFQYFDDGHAPNAFAWSQTLIKNTSGTIFFGINLVREELRHSYGGAAIAGIAAHEAAHIYQFFSNYRGLRDHGSAVRMELHADLLAGYYFAASGRTERSLRVFADSLFEKGDYHFNSPGHHGTPKQRVNAMMYGYRLAEQGQSLSNAAAIGSRYVS